MTVLILAAFFPLNYVRPEGTQAAMSDQSSLQKYIMKTIILPMTLSAMLLISACASQPEQGKPEPPVVPFINIDTSSVTTFTNFSGSLEGISNIEVRPQVEGYLEKIFVDEGAYVTAGQTLFLINDRPYNEQLNNANAAIETAKANMQKAQIDFNRLQRLVEGKVISPVQLENAQAVLNAEKANLTRAQSIQKAAAINKGYTRIKAEVSGYIGRIPYKVGSLVGHNEPLPLTILSDIHQMYAYFSMSEQDFLLFKQHYPGRTMEEKIKNMANVTLLLPDNSEYPQKGKVEMVEGQFDKTTAAITFRASFPNESGLLRSGNTGTVVLPQYSRHVIQIPQSATFELQNKVMAFVIDKNNKLDGVSLQISGKDDTSYIVSAGLKPGDRIVSNGLQRLHEDMVVRTSAK
jgi:membrane fusion protein (multidrug efflux system)